MRYKYIRGNANATFCTSMLGRTVAEWSICYSDFSLGGSANAIVVMVVLVYVYDDLHQESWTALSDVVWMARFTCVYSLRYTQ